MVFLGFMFVCSFRERQKSDADFDPPCQSLSRRLVQQRRPVDDHLQLDAAYSAPRTAQQESRPVAIGQVLIDVGCHFQARIEEDLWPANLWWSLLGHGNLHQLS